MFHPSAYENARPDGFGVLEVVGDGDAGQARRFVPLRRTELRGEVAGPLAALRLTQVFGYVAAQCDRVLEAAYRFPLPGDAAVTAVRVRFGDAEIRAELKERQQAEADYDRAKEQGRQAALATREAPDVFTLQVAGIRPDQEVTVETSYVQLARPEGPGWSLRIPLTTAPRYVRSDEAGTRPAAGQPLGLLRDPGHRFALDLAVRGADAVESPTHPLEVARDGDRRRVRLRDGEVLPDRDCVLTWRVAQDRDRPALHVLVHDDAAAGHAYFLALVAPPAARDPGRGVPREVVLLVDHSGSMDGPKWQAADWAVERFLADLTKRDAFALGLFHTTTRWLGPAPGPAEERAVGEAVAFLEKHRDSGGTELGVALEQALGLGRAAGERARHVLIVTDAQVSDEGRILRLAEAESRRVDRRRISLLCLDAAPNSYLALELADRGGGVARFLTSDPEQGDIATALDEVLADWSEPVLAGLRLEVDRPGVQVAGHAVSESDGRGGIDLGDLPAGRPLWVVGRVPRGEGGPLSFRLATGGGHELAGCQIELAGEAPEGRALTALFGARRVLALEHLIHAGYAEAELGAELRRLGHDPDRVLEGRPEAAPKVYAENARADAVAALRGLLVREALGCGLASSETAFVAVRSEAGRAVEGRVAVANALPAGWSEDFLMAPGFAGAGRADALCVKGPGAASPASRVRPARSRRRRLLRAGDGGARPAMGRAPRAAVPGEEGRAPSHAVVFGGVPTLTGGEATLFDSARDRGGLPREATLTRLVVRFPEGPPDPRGLDPSLELRLFVDDPTTPRARVRLADLVRRRGERPLNLRVGPGQAVRIVLADPAGAWARGAPRIEVALGW